MGRNLTISLWHLGQSACHVKLYYVMVKKKKITVGKSGRVCCHNHISNHNNHTTNDITQHTDAVGRFLLKCYLHGTRQNVIFTTPDEMLSSWDQTKCCTNLCISEVCCQLCQQYLQAIYVVRPCGTPTFRQQVFK